MNGILFAKLKMFVRTPWLFILMAGMSLLFAWILGSTDGGEKISIPIYAEDENIQHNVIGDSLKTSDTFEFNWMSEQEVEGKIASGKANIGVKLEADDFQLLVGGVESLYTNIVKSTVAHAYERQKQQQQIIAATDPETKEKETTVQKQMQDAIETPVFTMDTESFTGADTGESAELFRGLFGFTLFFVIYTVSYNVLPILTERADGIWDRVILSPVKKWEMYVSNLIYSFLTGYFQVLIVFLIFRFGVGVEFGGRFGEMLLLLIPYIFTIVALAVLLTALVKNQAQFSALLPLLSISMAMIGGAFWPIEMVDSQILLALAKINPLTYGMEILNGVAVYGYSLEKLLYPISILLLMGVLLMGVGMHLIEKRHI